MVGILELQLSLPHHSHHHQHCLSTTPGSTPSTVSRTTPVPQHISGFTTTPHVHCTAQQALSYGHKHGGPRVKSQAKQPRSCKAPVSPPSQRHGLSLGTKRSPAHQLGTPTTGRQPHTGSSLAGRVPALWSISPNRQSGSAC